MRTFVGHGLRLQEGGHLGFDLVTFGLLEEEDAIGEKLVVSTHLRVNGLCARKSRSVAKITATRWELGLVDRDILATEGVDQSAIEVLEQPPAVLGERGC